MNTMEFIAACKEPEFVANFLTRNHRTSGDVIWSDGRISGVENLVVDDISLDAIAISVFALERDGLLGRLYPTAAVFLARANAAYAAAGRIERDTVELLVFVCTLSCVGAADDAGVVGVGITVDGREIPARL